MLWEDLVDFPVQRGPERGRKSEWWSWKLNRPGRRFMVLMDGKGRVKKVWGGYSPKIYDGQYVAATEEWYHQNLGGVGVFADEHFRKTTEDWKDPVFYCPHKVAKGWTERKEEEMHISDGEENDQLMRDLKDNPEGEGVCKLTASQQAWNNAQRKMRAKVEGPFAQTKGKWKALAVPWAEEPEQLDCLVFTAFAVWNMSRD